MKETTAKRNTSGQQTGAVSPPAEPKAVQSDFGARMRAYRAANPVVRKPGPLHAESPQFRESGNGLVGVGISGRRKCQPPRMAKILHAMGLTKTQFTFWCGFSTAEWVKANPSWTERQFFELLSENIDTIRVTP